MDNWSEMILDPSLTLFLSSSCISECRRAQNFEYLILGLRVWTATKPWLHATIALHKPMANASFVIYSARAKCNALDVLLLSAWGIFIFIAAMEADWPMVSAALWGVFLSSFFRDELTFCSSLPPIIRRGNKRKMVCSLSLMCRDNTNRA